MSILSQKSPTEFRTIHVQLEVPILAPRQRVWDALVNQTTQWWRKDFLTRESLGFHIEPRIGGRAYEDRGDGNGTVWFNVIAVDAPESIQLIGHLTPRYGGPAQSMLEITIESRDAHTSLLKLHDTLCGNLSETAARAMDEGWRLLFEDALKRFVERAGTAD